jgi:hypothetical protein
MPAFLNPSNVKRFTTQPTSRDLTLSAWPRPTKKHAKSGFPTHMDLALGETRTPHRYGARTVPITPFEEHVTPNTSK